MLTGNVLCSKGGKFGPTGTLDPSYFYLDYLTSSTSYISFRPRLKGIGTESSYKILLKVIPSSDSDIGKFSICSDELGSTLEMDKTTYLFALDNNRLYTITPDSIFTSAKFSLNFIIVTRGSNTTVLQKIYNVKITGSITGGQNSIESGSVIQGDPNNKDNNYYKEDDMNVKEELENGSSNNGNINVGDVNLDSFKNFSFENLLERCKEGFNSFALMFNLLPKFVWEMVGVFILLCLVLRLIGK